MVRGDALDLTTVNEPSTLDGEVALTAIASAVPGIFERHPFTPPDPRGCTWRINPLYALDDRGDDIHGRLTFPSVDYEDEYGACRQYLPDDVLVDRAALTALQAGASPEALHDLIRRRVIVALPTGYV